MQFIGVVLFASFLNYDLSDGPDGVNNKAGYLFTKVMLFSFMPANGVVLQCMFHTKQAEILTIISSRRKAGVHEGVCKRNVSSAAVFYIQKSSRNSVPISLCCGDILGFVLSCSCFVISYCYLDYFVVGFETDVKEFFQVLLICCIVALIGSSIGLVVGAGIRDVGSGMELAPAVIIPQILVAGLFIKL
jgi:hypothetical protein